MHRNPAAARATALLLANTRERRLRLVEACNAAEASSMLNRRGHSAPRAVDCRIGACERVGDAAATLAGEHARPDYAPERSLRHGDRVASNGAVRRRLPSWATKGKWHRTSWQRKGQRLRLAVPRGPA
jgi:hypothetical protein